jgi:hypothetical protein
MLNLFILTVRPGDARHGGGKKFYEGEAINFVDVFFSR